MSVPVQVTVFWASAGWLIISDTNDDRVVFHYPVPASANEGLTSASRQVMCGRIAILGGSRATALI
jgi:hypothetical protein